MNIEIVNLSEENLVDAPEWSAHPFSCRYCIYWEYPEERVDAACEHRQEMLEKKRVWFRRTLREFGNCGKLLYADGRGTGYAQYAPPGRLPNSAEYDAGPPSDDAVFLSCLLIAPRQMRGSGLGNRLLRSIIDDLTARGVAAVETLARRGNPENPSGPMEFYLRNGFTIHKDDKEFPLMRLELRPTGRLR